jgi:hypothetical protein
MKINLLPVPEEIAWLESRNPIALNFASEQFGSNGTVVELTMGHSSWLIGAAVCNVTHIFEVTYLHPVQEAGRRPLEQVVELKDFELLFQIQTDWFEPTGEQDKSLWEHLLNNVAESIRADSHQIVGAIYLAGVLIRSSEEAWLIQTSECVGCLDVRQLSKSEMGNYSGVWIEAKSYRSFLASLVTWPPK